MSEYWHFSNGEAIASLPGGEIRVDPTKPAQGAKIRHGELDWPALAVHAMPKHGSKVLEAYARQADLIAQYGEGMDDTYRYHLYWRVLSRNHGGASAESSSLGVELWLGVQTGLLDSTPLLNVVCGSEQDSWQVYEHADLCSTGASNGSHVAALVSRSNQGSAVWLIEPSDQMHANLNADGATPSIGLFGHFMEKGVIRRGRMRFYAFPGEVSVEQVAESYEEFADSELPLTA